MGMVTESLYDMVKTGKVFESLSVILHRVVAPYILIIDIRMGVSVDETRSITVQLGYCWAAD
jgi:hypothetical protein